MLELPAPGNDPMNSPWKNGRIKWFAFQSIQQCFFNSCFSRSCLGVLRVCYYTYSLFKPFLSVQVWKSSVKRIRVSVRPVLIRLCKTLSFCVRPESIQYILFTLYGPSCVVLATPFIIKITTSAGLLTHQLETL